MRIWWLIPAVLLSLLAGWLVWREGALPRTHEAFIPAPGEHSITPLPAAVEVDPRLAALGRRLFHDKRLSRDNSIACATCHRFEHAGADARPTSPGVGGAQGQVNSPTVLNSAFNFRLFWDGRSDSLEDQVRGPIHNPIEMASSWPEVLAKLRGDAAYQAEFRSLWADGVQAEHVQAAIAAFERTLITPDAPFDRFLRGEHGALSAQARNGWTLFSDLGCIACHQGVNIGGNMYANLGIMGDYFADRGGARNKADLGRFNVTGREQDKHVFKVPSLRNVARTAPYFHDGSVPTLDDAIDIMARYQIGVSLDAAQRGEIVAFLRSLDGRLPEMLAANP